MNPFKKAYQNLKNKWVNKTASLNSPTFLDWLGIGKRRKPTAEVTYFTCLKMLSETLAKMPIKTYQKTEGGVVEPEGLDVEKVLKTRPNPFMTPTTFWNTVEMNRNHYGNAYVYIRRGFERKKYGGTLKVIDIWIMPSECVQIVVDDAGYFGGKGRIWYKYTEPIGKQQYIYGTDDVMHFKTSHSFDGITGLPVQKILESTVSGAGASQDFMNRMYETGLTAKATLEYTGELNEKAKTALVESFEEFGAGAKNTGRIIPVPLGMKLTPLDIKMTDSQFFELKKYTALQMAAAFGVKPNQINDYEKASYSNSEMQQLSFYVDTVLFIIKQYEEEINYKLLMVAEQEEGIYCKFNEKVLFRTDSKTQMEYLTNAVKNSVYTPNEARRKLDMEDTEGGNRLYANGNVIPLEKAGTQYLKKTTEGGEGNGED
jgi:phage portal protein, HK97 family